MVQNFLASKAEGNPYTTNVVRQNDKCNIIKNSQALEHSLESCTFYSSNKDF